MKKLIFSLLVLLSSTAHANPPVLWSGSNAQFINSGSVNFNLGSNTTPAINFGTSNTGYYGISSTAMGIATGGTEVARWTSTGLEIGGTTALSTALAVFQNASVDTGFNLVDTNGNRWSFEIHPNNFILEVPSSGNAYLWFCGPNAGTCANWLALGPQTQKPRWPIDFNVPNNAVDNVTSLSQFIPNNGSVFPTAVVMQNLYTGAGTMAGFVTTGSSQNAMSFAGTIHTTQTAASEQSEYILASQNNGTLTEGFRLKHDQTMQFKGYTAGSIQTDSSGNVTATAPGTSGNVLTSNGTSWVSSAAPTANDPKETVNLGFAASASGGTLTVALKQADGTTDPASGSGAVTAAFRSATTTSGAYQLVSFTAANSFVTNNSGDTLGCPTNLDCTLYVYLIQDTTNEVCVSYTQFDERVVQTGTALTGLADTDGTKLYCPSAHTTRPIRLIGKATDQWRVGGWQPTTAPISIVSANDSNISSGTSGLERIERARFSGSGSISLVSQTGNWIASQSRTSAGIYVITAAAGTFSATPTCIVSGGYNGGSASGYACEVGSAAGISTTNIPINCGVAGVSNNDQDFNLVCMGPR